MFGVLQVDAGTNGHLFTDLDLELLGGIALQMSMAVSNARLHSKNVRRLELDRELDLARSVQVGLLPANSPDFPGYEFYDFYVPAGRVGGDSFDYVELPNGDLAVVVADVSGHGLPAALVSMKLVSEIRALLSVGVEIGDALKHVNDGILTSEKFATLALLRLHRDSPNIEIVNAGHWPPLVRDVTGNVQRIGEESAGLMLGVVDGVDILPARAVLEPGSVAVMFSDGVLDAAVGDGANNYGEQRLRSRIESGPFGADGLGQWIMDDVMDHCDPSALVDDVTLVCVGAITAK